MIAQRNLFLLALILACTARYAAADGLTIDGNVVKPMTLTMADLAKMPHQSLKLTNPHNGKVESYEGVLLMDVLRAASAPVGEKLRGKTMSAIVIAEASDRYRAAFALAELDPGTGDAAVLLADRMDGAALDKDSGPLRLVVPKDKRPARWIRMLTALHVSNDGG